MNRRSFLLSCPALVAAPSLMRVVAPVWTPRIVDHIDVKYIDVQVLRGSWMHQYRLNSGTDLSVLAINGERVSFRTRRVHLDGTTSEWVAA